MRRTLRKTLLIVCEGKNTEPIYFGILKDKAIEEGVWDNVVIVPEPPKLNADADDNDKPKTRTFRETEKSVERPLDTIDVTERKYLPKGKDNFPTPLNFVKEARDKLSSGAFDEAWAVFDKDEHPAHEAAFALAAEIDKPVNIAFSSRSFEQWILLHYERNQTTFEATECKIRQKREKTTTSVPLGCMTDKPLAGSCEGDKCLVGYIRKNHLTQYSKMGNMLLNKQFKTLIDTQCAQALTNTAWLTAKQAVILRGSNKIYLMNPYTTVDVLVKKMLGIDENIEWIELGDRITSTSIYFVFELIEKQRVAITFTNNSKNVFLLNPTNLSDIIYCVDTENVKYPLNLAETFQLLPKETKTCILTSTFSFSAEMLIHFKIDNHHFIVQKNVDEV